MGPKDERGLGDQTIGILMLDTRFPRIMGDVGNAGTYDFPVRFKVVKGASITRVVREGDPALLDPFIKAAKELENDGVRAVTTSCGFLSIFQEEIAASVGVPVFTSALMLVPLVHRMLGPERKVGIVTADSTSLSERHLRAVGADPSTVVIGGMQNEQEFSKIDSDQLHFDPGKVREETVRVSKELAKSQSVRAIVFECTNLPPYAEAVHRATSLPVFDIVTLVRLVHDSVVMERRFGAKSV